MRLRYSPSSPFVRKVIVFAIETGLDARIERVPTNPMKRADTASLPNPLGKVPALETDDGMVLYDSPVILEYLDTLHGGPPLIPREGRARWDALRRQALADGILDAVVLTFVESLRQPERRSRGYVAHLGAAVERAVAALDTEVGALTDPTGRPDVAAIAVGCALGFVDFHFKDFDWRAKHPALATWYDAFARRPSMTATIPVDPRTVA
jgi:glutathione S-transferase